MKKLHEKKKLKPLTKSQIENLTQAHFNTRFIENKLIPCVNRFVDNYNNGLKKDTAFTEACDEVGLSGEKLSIKMQRELISDMIAETYKIMVEYEG